MMSMGLVFDAERSAPVVISDAADHLELSGVPREESPAVWGLPGRGGGESSESHSGVEGGRRSATMVSVVVVLGERFFPD